MSCESVVYANEERDLVLSCDGHGPVRVFDATWNSVVSAEHVYAVWLKHLGEQ